MPIIRQTSPALSEFLNIFSLPSAQTKKGQSKLKEETDGDTEILDDHPQYISLDPKRTLKHLKRSPDDDTDRITTSDFWRLYFDLPHPKCLAEYQGWGYTSLVIDSDWYCADCPTQLQINQHISDVVRTARSIISRNVTTSDNNSSPRIHLIFIVLANKHPKLIEDEHDDNNGLWKVGYHLHLPKIMMERPDKIRFMKELNARYPEIDTKAAINPWLLYGSCKDRNSTPYSISYIYDHNHVRINNHLEYLSALWETKITENTLPMYMSLCPWREAANMMEHPPAWTEMISEWIIDDAEIKDDRVSKVYDVKIMPLTEAVNSAVSDHLRSINVSDQFKIDGCPNQTGFYQLIRIKAGKCPLDGVSSHSRLNGWVLPTDIGTKIGCFSAKCKGKCKVI